MTPLQRFFTWGYKKYVLMPYLKDFNKDMSCAELKAIQVQHALHEKEALRRYDRRTDH